MEDIGNWIYFIIAIFWVILSVIGRSRKKAQKQPGQPGSNSTGNQTAKIPGNNENIKTLLDLFTEGETNQYNTPVNVVEEVEKDEQVAEDYSKTEEHDKLDTITEEGTPTTLEDEKELEVDIKEDIIEGFTIENFDVKQAIIYSEILTRKEY